MGRPSVLNRTPPWLDCPRARRVPWSCRGLQAIVSFFRPRSGSGRCRRDGAAGHPADPRRLGLARASHPRPLDSMGHNWWSVCVSGARWQYLADEPGPRAGSLRGDPGHWRGFFRLHRHGATEQASEPAVYESVNYAEHVESYLTFRLAMPTPWPRRRRRWRCSSDSGHSTRSIRPPAATHRQLRRFAARAPPGHHAVARRAGLFAQAHPMVSPAGRPRRDRSAHLGLPRQFAKHQQEHPSVLYSVIGWATLRDS